MTSPSSSVCTLAGQSFDCVFDAFVPRITFQSHDTLRVEARIGEREIDEVLTADVTEVRPRVFLIRWTEENGNFVVQLQDHETGVVHNHARLADGQVVRAVGALLPVT